MSLPALGDLPLAVKVAQLFCLALPSSDAEACERACDDLEAHAWGGFIFDKRRDDRALLDRLRAAAPIPLLVAADLEMGAGQHFDEGSRFPHAMAFGATGDPDLARRLGRLTALEARNAGVNWVLAPVADVNSNPDNPIINVRSFGGDPSRVAAFVAAFVRGCEENGAIACAKHFPGHGDTSDDSHSRLATVCASPARLSALEWVPFEAAIAAGVGSVMSAHVAVPALDPSGRPATLSAPILQGGLRGTLAYEGLVVSDALIMGGVTGAFGPEEAAVEALKAGCDVLLMPPDPKRALSAVLGAIETGELDEARIDRSLARVFALKERVIAMIPGVDPATLRHEAQALAREVAEGALSVLQARTGALPLDPGLAFHLVIDDDDDAEAFAPWVSALSARALPAPRVLKRESTDADFEAIASRLNPGQPVLCAVFSTIKAWKERIDLAPAHAAFLERLAGAGHAVVALSFSNPYLANQLPGAAAFVCAYSDHPASQQAALSGVAGEIPMPGRLPVALGV
ncbi:MAG TPA: glycoside hydrolase family 3 protein [Pantanalinema sp.]